MQRVTRRFLRCRMVRGRTKESVDVETAGTRRPDSELFFGAITLEPGGPWANDVYENLDQSALALPKIDVDPLEPNVWEQWYSWYQLHYHQFLGLLCGFLVVLCGLNLSASCQREQDTQYVGVKRVSDTDTECDVEV